MAGNSGWDFYFPKTKVPHPSITSRRFNRHGEHEALFLDDLDEIAKTGVCPAERLLERYYGAWGESVEPVFEEAVH